MIIDNSDFTEKNYKKIIKRIRNKCIFYNEVGNKKKFTLWRHDVDFSPHRAHALAKIEKTNNLKSTYFIQLNSAFYNIFEEEIKSLFLKVLSFGHQLGLHFDFNSYEINSKDELEEYLTYEKKILEKLFKIKIKAFSFHNPTKKILKYNDFKYANMINAYAKYFKDNVIYCSDSNGYWRHQKLENFFNNKYDKIQVLTHPVWWQKKITNPRQKIVHAANERAQKCIKNYDKLLKKSRRINF